MHCNLSWKSRLLISLLCYIFSRIELSVWSCFMNKGLSRFEPCARLEDRVLSKSFCLIEFLNLWLE
mgnify:CR=1 FL=1